MTSDLELEINSIEEAFGGEGLKQERTTLTGHIVSAPYDAARGIGAGIGNFASETVDSLTDIGFMGAMGIGRGVDWAMGNEYDAESEKRMWESKDRLVKNLTGRLNFDDQDDEPVYNFTKLAVEEIARFSTIFKTMGKTGLGTVQKGAIATLGSGALVDPEEDIGISNFLTGSALTAIDPNLKTDFDLLMSPETDDMLARHTIRRMMNMVDYGMMGGVSAVAAKGAAVAGEKAINAIPDKTIRAVRDKYANTLKQARSLIESRRDNLKGERLVSKMKSGAADAIVKVKDDVDFSPDKNAWQNINDTIDIGFDSTEIIQPENISQHITNFETKLEALAPQINAKVVSMAKSKGVAAEEELERFVRQIGGDALEYDKTKSLKDVLKTQAHNIVADQEAQKFAMSYRDYTKGTMNEKAWIESVKSFTAMTQNRLAHVGGAGRTLRTSQEVNQFTRKVLDDFKDQGRTFDALSKKMGLELSDDQMAVSYGKEVAKSLGLKKQLGLSEDEYLAAILKGADGAGSIVDGVKRSSVIMQAIKDTPEALGRLTQANLLTGTPTLVLNSAGSVGMQMLNVSESFIRAGLSSNRTKEFGAAMALGSGTAKGYKSAFLNLLRQSEDGTKKTIRSKFADMPPLSKEATKRLGTLTKEDMSSQTGNTVIDGIHKLPYAGKALTGHWSFGLIGAQDALHKAPYALGKLNEKLYRGFYVDDMFDLANSGIDEKQAYKAVERMFYKGGSALDMAELKQLGMKEEDALILASRLKNWVNENAVDAVKDAEVTVFQAELPKMAESARKILQDSGDGAGKVITPFFSTPFNVVNESMKRLPMIPIGDAVGIPLHPKVLKLFNGTAEEKAQVMSMLISGNLLAQVGYQLAEAGFYQPVPVDGATKGFLRTSLGLTPGSLLIDDKSYTTNPLGPMHYLLAQGAGQYQNKIVNVINHVSDEQRQTYDQLLQANMLNLMNVFLESPLAATPDQLAELLKDLSTMAVTSDPLTQERGKRKVAEFMGMRAGNLFPSSALSRTISNNLMDSQRRAHGFSEAAQSQFAPWLVDQTAYNNYLEPYEPSKGMFLRYTKIAQAPLESVLFAETGFYPKSTYFDFNAIMDNPSRYKNPSVNFNLAEHGLWTEFIELSRDGLRKEMDLYRQSKLYKDNMALDTSQGLDYNQKALQAIMDEKKRDAFKQLRSNYPNIDSILESKTKERVSEKGKKTGIIPSFTGAE